MLSRLPKFSNLMLLSTMFVSTTLTLLAFIQATATQPDPLKQFVEAAAPFFNIGAVVVVGLMIRSSMAEAALRNAESAADVKAELVEQNAITRRALDVHTARDEEIAKSITQKLEQGDRRFDKIDQKLDTLQRTKT